jgi:hypothetical protein
MAVLGCPHEQADGISEQSIYLDEWPRFGPWLRGGNQ